MNTPKFWSVKAVQPSFMSQSMLFTHTSHFSSNGLRSENKILTSACMGTKAGMSSWFEHTGDVVPCTIIGFEEGNIVTQVKTQHNDGYNSVQIAYKPSKVKNMTKPTIGHLQKASVAAFRHLAEFRTVTPPDVQVGEKLEPLKMFQEGELINVSGRSIGKGFQGGIKRWNMHRGFMTHGSKSHRAPGSIGMRYSGSGGRVMPGLKMPGQMGNKRVTIQKLRIIKIDTELNALVVKGSVPGITGTVLSLTPAKV